MKLIELHAVGGEVQLEVGLIEWKWNVHGYSLSKIFKFKYFSKCWYQFEMRVAMEGGQLHKHIRELRKVCHPTKKCWWLPKHLVTKSKSVLQTVTNELRNNSVCLELIRQCCGPISRTSLNLKLIWKIYQLNSVLKKIIHFFKLVSGMWIAKEYLLLCVYPL